MDTQQSQNPSGDDFSWPQEPQLPDELFSSWVHAQEAAQHERDQADTIAIVQRFHPGFSTDDAIQVPEVADAEFPDYGNSSFSNFMNTDDTGTPDDIEDTEDGNATAETLPDVSNLWPGTIAIWSLAGGFTGGDYSGLGSSPDYTSTVSMDTSTAYLTPMSPPSIFTHSPDAVFGQPTTSCLTVEPYKLIEPSPVILGTPQPMGSNEQATITQPEGSSPRKRKGALGTDKSGPKTMSMREFRRITKPEPCPYCDRGGQYTRDLERHVRTHTKKLGHAVPRFPCTYPGCDKSYGREDRVKRHADLKHPGWYDEGGKKRRRHD